MMIKLARTISTDRRGAAAVEFALAVPIIIVLIVSTMKMGLYFFAQNSIKTALDETARKASVYPSPSDESLQTVFAANLLKREVTVPVTMQISRGTSNGVSYVSLQSNYNVPVDLIFYNLGNIPISAKQRAYIPPP